MVHILKLWLDCLRLYLRLCLFQASPGALPYNPATLALTLTAYYLAALWLLADQYSALKILVLLILETSLLALITFSILALVTKKERLLQTLSGLVGVNLIVTMVSVPLQSMIPEAEPGQSSGISMQINIIILLWNLAALSLIFKRAAEISTVLAGFITFNYFLLNQLLLIQFL